ncbi:hypothetical protein C2845_PM13G09120 [Panicum miliaceum]|uniref:Disease resistance R13L4/SHOC-2-like LRR domain-containing protein n=1 Tax=Panicum miliaceum TaxID=4540 RepID=A0A3L6RID4_PANMI|nr:hypothetical protein C2845_PM13G09120 [Panicum miliaceum]
MHDLVYDLARSIMDEGMIVYNPNKMTSVADQQYYRYALLTNCSEPLKISTILPAKLRALLFNDCSKLDLRGSAFTFSKCLRVLDLSESSISKLPDSLGNLKQLRFLIAPGLKNPKFPVSITRITKLQYLDIHGSSQVTTILESIGKLDCLMHLDLSGCIEIVKMPESLGNLKKLLHLELSSCSRLERIPESVYGLTKLQYLNLSGCSKLQRLPQDLCSLVELQYFSISGCSKIPGLPVGFGKLTNLFHLDLSRCSFVMLEEFGGFTELKYLNLSGSLSNNRQDERAFFQLSRLTLSNMERLEDWSTTNSSNIERLPQDLCILPKLQYLNLSCCSNLESLPQDLGELTELQNLCLSHSCKLNVLPESLGKLTNLVHLDLSQRPFVMVEALSGLTKLKYLNLSGSLHTNDRQAEKSISYISTLTNLEHLDLSWNFFGYLPESLGNLKRLRVLDISGCKHLSSIPVSISSIDSLEMLSLIECSEGLKNNNFLFGPPPKCSQLPLFNVLPNSGDSGSNLLRLKGINPSELEILHLENVRIPGETNEIEYGGEEMKAEEVIKTRNHMHNKENLSKLRLQWHMGSQRTLNDKDVMAELVPPSGLC